MELKVYLPSTSFNPTPVVVSFTPDTTTKEVVQDLYKKFQVRGEERTLVITPTSASSGGVVDPRSFIKSINLDGEERLELWKAPFLINILLVSDFTTPDPIKQRKEIIVDYGSPLSYNIPLLRRIFNLDEEFVFQYIHSLDDEKNMTRLDSKKSLADQSFEGTYWLICSPVKLLKGKDGISRCNTEACKEGFLVKQTRKGSKQTAKQRRWAVLKDQFLFYFKNKGDAYAAGVIPLEYYTINMVQIKQQSSLHLKRAIGRFDESNADMYMLYADDGDDLLKWKEILQRKCLGSGNVFGVTLHETTSRSTIKPHIPDIVTTLTEYLTEKALDDEGILRIAGSNAMVQFYKDQFDRGIDVDLSAVHDVHVVASLLKMYFRELPDPAIPFNFYDEVIEIMTMRGPQKTNDVTPLLLEVMSKLPDAHFYVVKHMCRFLFEVQKHSAINLMALPAIGTVMGPNLLRPPDSRIGSFVQDSVLISEFIQILIKNHDLIRKADTALKTLPRPAPMRSEDSKTSLLTSSFDATSPPTPAAARPKRPAKATNKARASIFEFKGAILLEPIPKQHQPMANPPRAAPLLSFMLPAASAPQAIPDAPQTIAQQILSKSPSKLLSIAPLSLPTSKKQPPTPQQSPHPTPRELNPTPRDLNPTPRDPNDNKQENEFPEPTKDLHKLENERARAESAKVDLTKGEYVKPTKGSVIAWNKAAARPRLSTIASPPTSTAALRHVTSATNISELITSIPVFDIDTVLLYLGKLDETKYKKEKISLDSIKGGIKGEYAKEKELVRQIFCNQVAYMLEVLENQKAKAPSASWASLFYQRGQKCEDVLPTSKLAHYEHLLTNYLRILRKKEAKEGQHPTITARIKLAESFLEFLETHSTDPDSCLIGLQCSEESLKSVMRHVDPSSSDPSHANTVSYQQLCSMIVEWGVGEDDAWMKEQIQKLCTTFRGVDKMEKGDVAIVAHGSEDGVKTMIFARFTGTKKHNNTHLEFFLNPEESKTDWVSIFIHCKLNLLRMLKIFRRDVYPIPSNMKEAIKNKAHLSKVVLDPAHSFFKILKESIP